MRLADTVRLDDILMQYCVNELPLVAITVVTGYDRWPLFTVFKRRDRFQNIVLGDK